MTKVIVCKISISITFYNQTKFIGLKRQNKKKQIHI